MTVGISRLEITRSVKFLSSIYYLLLVVTRVVFVNCTTSENFYNNIEYKDFPIDTSKIVDVKDGPRGPG